MRVTKYNGNVTRFRATRVFNNERKIEKTSLHYHIDSVLDTVDHSVIHNHYSYSIRCFPNNNFFFFFLLQNEVYNIFTVQAQHVR